MRIAFAQLWHGEQMGYVDNFLPAAVAALGHEVHLVTTNVQPYYNLPSYRETYEPHFGPAVVPPGVRLLPSGVTLHRLPHGHWRGLLRMRGLYATLRTLRPDIVQGFALNTCPTYEIALYKPRLGYTLFLEARAHRSVFAAADARTPGRERLRWKLWKRTAGRLISAMTHTCFPISTDCADVAIRFFGLSPRKIRIAPLGTETTLFRPPWDDAGRKTRRQIRARLGFADDEIVCIYTGRLTREKGPLVLAHAVIRLIAERRPFRGLFVGDGPAAIVEKIRGAPGCVVHPFVPTKELVPLYQAADIGVWPRQESTSQLDAAACGLPLVLDEAVQVRERIAGNGLTYAGGDSDDLAEKLGQLADPAVRAYMARLGRRRMVEYFDWARLARLRVAEYEAALGMGPPARADTAGPAVAASPCSATGQVRGDQNGASRSAQRAPSRNVPSVRMRMPTSSSSERCLR
ncbi:MAG: glycosyltransferase family 4 protein [Planctomycetota bacterium]